MIDRDRFINRFGQIAKGLAVELVRKIRPNIGIGIGRMLAQLIFVSTRYEDILGKMYIGVDEALDFSLVVIDQESDAVLEVEVVLLTRLASPGIFRSVNTAERFIEWRVRDLTQDSVPEYLIANTWRIEGVIEGEIASGAKRLRNNLFDCLAHDQLEHLKRNLSAPFLQ